MKKVTHWLHIILVLLTGGFWLLPYVVILATTQMYNRGYKAAINERHAVENAIASMVKESPIKGNVASIIIDGVEYAPRP